MDRTPDLNELLRKQHAPPVRTEVTLENIDGFLKEALRINTHIAELHRSLLSGRRAYLARAQPRKGHSSAADGQPAVLSDKEREAVDKDAKEMLRELNWSIETLDSAETIRYETEMKSIQKQYGSGLGALGAWASGGAVSGKTQEQSLAEARAEDVRLHRDGVLWYLRQRLQLCGATQKKMMETRLIREVEASRSLASQAPSMTDFSEFRPSMNATESHDPSRDPSSSESQGLSAEQVQMFEEGNRDMMKFFDSMHKSVQTAQKSLAEISDLQSTLISHLATQTEQIDHLVADSFSTTENVEGGNKQLKRATQRPSTARMTFYATSGLCAFLVLWDLIF